MMLHLKILFLLWSINFTPPLLAHLMDSKWSKPLDLGICFRDGKPLLGGHKTIRGLIGAVLTGTVIAPVLGLPWWLGFVTSVLSMGGDLVSSFLKRRMSLPCGSIAPGLDQVLEGGFPFLVLGPFFSLGGFQVSFLIALFGVGAYMGSWFLKRILRERPYARYPRTVRSGTRLREVRSCQIVAPPFHHLLNIEDSLYYLLLMKTAFRMLGLYGKGRRNALRVRVCREIFYLEDLPDSFDGYSILFLSDLHLDGLDGLTERVRDVVKDLTVDLCVFGGDLRMQTHGPYTEALELFGRLVPHIRARDGIVGILGNHDCTQMIEPMAEMGVEFLINDAKAVRRGEQEMWLVGVDDPHYYKCHDLERAFGDVPEDAFTVFLAHSNEIYKEASSYHPDLYLCGHSHAGQIQIPPIGPIFTHSKAPRYMCHGAWRYREMPGYTSGGVGTSGVPVRFFCEGEVSLIILRCGKQEAAGHRFQEASAPEAESKSPPHWSIRGSGYPC